MFEVYYDMRIITNAQIVFNFDFVNCMLIKLIQSDHKTGYNVKNNHHTNLLFIFKTDKHFNYVFLTSKIVNNYQNHRQMVFWSVYIIITIMCIK